MRKILNLCYLSLTIFIFAFSCSKDDKDKVISELEGRYTVAKIELGAQGVWADMTSYLLADCEKNIIIEFKDNKVSTTDPSNDCDSDYIYSGTYTIDGNKIESSTVFQGEILTNNESQLVIKGSFQQQDGRITLNKVR